MAPFERSARQKIIMNTVTYIGLGGLAPAISLLLAAAFRLSGPVRRETVELVAIGPLQLFHLSKEPLAAGGYAVSMQLRSGVLVYIAATVGVGLLLGCWRVRRAARRQIIPA
jgi:hypothetical protein